MSYAIFYVLKHLVHEYDMVLVCESLTQSAIADEKSVLLLLVSVSTSISKSQLLLVKETVSLPQSAIAN